MLEKIQNAVKGIMVVIIKLNTLFSKERGQIENLEKVLNKLGKPGCYFEGNSFHEEDDRDGQDRTWTSLAFDNGEICIVEVGYGVSSKEIRSLTCLALHKVDAMLEALPTFLQDYQKHLEGMEIDNSLTHGQLILVVQAISMIVGK